MVLFVDNLITKHSQISQKHKTAAGYFLRRFFTLLFMHSGIPVSYQCQLVLHMGAELGGRSMEHAVFLPRQYMSGCALRGKRDKA